MERRKKLNPISVLCSTGLGLWPQFSLSLSSSVSVCNQLISIQLIRLMLKRCVLLSGFKKKPPTPPSMAQAALLTAEPEEYLSGIKRLLTNKGYLLLLLSYGMNVGVFYAISTLLNSFILPYFEVKTIIQVKSQFKLQIKLITRFLSWQGAGQDIGRIGLTIVVAGMCGSVISGFILDTTKRFK